MKRAPWMPEEIEILRRTFAINPTWKIAKVLGRTDSTVSQKAAKLGLKKSPKFLDSPASGRMRPGSSRGGATRFQKGQEPPNKGLRRPGWAPGRMAATQFKKGGRTGRAAENYQPIGTERVSKDGYQERKVHDGMPLQSRWRAVHLIRWEAINGPLPKGHALVFRDGDKANTDPRNMELVTRAELMRRNSYHNRYPKEVGLLIQLRGAVVRKINRRSRAA